MKGVFVLALWLGNIAVAGIQPTMPLTVSGRVIDESGNGIPGVELTAYLTLGTTSRIVVSSTNGAFTIPVSNGTWFLDVTGNLPDNKIWPKHVFVIAGTYRTNIEEKL